MLSFNCACPSFFDRGANISARKITALATITKGSCLLPCGPAKAVKNIPDIFVGSRFKSQALLTDEAVLSAMAYVDLNPVRTCMADTPEKSDYTSIKERIKPAFDLTESIKQQTSLEAIRHFDLPLKPLLKFEGNLNNSEQTGIVFRQVDYINLVDWTGRIIRNDKRGAINENLPPILERLSIDIDAWLLQTQHFEKNYQALFSKRRQKSKRAA